MCCASFQLLLYPTIFNIRLLDISSCSQGYVTDSFGISEADDQQDDVEVDPLLDGLAWRTPPRLTVDLCGVFDKREWNSTEKADLNEAHRGKGSKNVFRRQLKLDFL